MSKHTHFDGPDDDMHGKIKHYMGKAYKAVENMHRDMIALKDMTFTWFHTINDQLANTQDAIIHLNKQIALLIELMEKDNHD